MIIKIFNSEYAFSTVSLEQMPSINKTIVSNSQIPVYLQFSVNNEYKIKIK
jgi:hypothetical protein